MKYLTIQQAAERSGLNEGHIRKMCQAWADRGHAKIVMEGGKPKWFISESADARLMTARMPHMLPADLTGASEKDRQIAYARIAILKQWEQFVTSQLSIGLTRSEATNLFVKRFGSSDELTFSRAALYRWEKLNRSEGLSGLLPKYIVCRESEISQEAMDAFRSYYLTQQKWSIRLTFELIKELAKQNNWSWFKNVRSCEMWVKATFSKPEITLNREGEKAYNAMCAPFIQRDPEQWQGNECLVGDHHELDMWCMHNGKKIRPWLTAWQDMRSKMITGWVLCPSPNSSTILLAFRRSCKSDFGPPGHVYMDNGKDYDCFALQGQTKAQRLRALGKGYINEGQVKGLFGQLGITVTFALPYNPQSKPIERTFRVLDDQFCKLFKTYCGNSTVTRPEVLADILADDSNIPSFQEVEKKIATWIDEVYHLTASDGKGMDGKCPLAVMRETQVSKRIADDRILDLMLMSWSKPVKVGKHGVVLNKINYGMGDMTLIQLQGREVRIAYDPANSKEVTIWDMAGRFLCRAKANAIVSGMTDEHKNRHGDETTHS